MPPAPNCETPDVPPAGASAEPRQDAPGPAPLRRSALQGLLGLEERNLGWKRIQPLLVTGSKMWEKPVAKLPLEVPTSGEKRKNMFSWGLWEVPTILGKAETSQNRCSCRSVLIMTHVELRPSYRAPWIAPSPNS